MVSVKTEAKNPEKELMLSTVSANVAHFLSFHITNELCIQISDYVTMNHTNFAPLKKTFQN